MEVVAVVDAGGLAHHALELLQVDRERCPFHQHGRREREEFVVEASYLMRDNLDGEFDVARRGRCAARVIAL